MKNGKATMKNHHPPDCCECLYPKIDDISTAKAANNNNDDDDDSTLLQAYMARLGLLPCQQQQEEQAQEEDVAQVPDTATTAGTRQGRLAAAHVSLSLPPPTLETLRLVTRRHLERLPFSNLAWHLQKNKTTTTNQSSNDNHPLDDDNVMTAASLDHPAQLVAQLLWHHGGGCCLQLNGSLYWLLQQLGFDSIALVPCFVAAGRERGRRRQSSHAQFRTTRSTHFVLLVRIPQPASSAATAATAQFPDREHDNNDTNNQHDDDCSSFIVDVGLGEPPLEPLPYVLDCVQVTPRDGMTSRIRWDPRGTWTDGQGRVRRCVILEWLVQNNDKDEPRWEPRLQWDVADAPLSASLPSPCGAGQPDNNNNNNDKKITLSSFAHVIPLLAHPKSSWSRKLVVCRLTPTHKITLAGNVLKITTPRSFFPSSTSVLVSEDDETNHKTRRHKQQQPIVTKYHLADDAAVHKVLRDYFGITLQPGEQLDWTATRHAQNTQLWEHL